MNMDDVFCFNLGSLTSCGWLSWDESKKVRISYGTGSWKEKEIKTLIINHLWFKYGHEILEYAKGGSCAQTSAN
jgi:hypothetical protein